MEYVHCCVYLMRMMKGCGGEYMSMTFLLALASLFHVSIGGVNVNIYYSRTHFNFGQNTKERGKQLSL